jgi:eukaryotic-like serine/threonine-protein kinase
MADAVSHAHEHDVVHRDLKAANVIVTPEGRAKVLDFGLAKPLLGKDLEAATTLTQASLTAAGAMVGTLAYMAPEQLRGKPADARSDVWALGVVLHEMAVGKRPFSGETGFEVSSAILNQTPKALPAGVPPALVGIIERCLAKEPAQRYQSAAEVRSALEVAQHSSAAGRERRRKSASGPRARAGRTRIRALAVLPLLNLSDDPAQEYFVDGMTEALTAELACLRGLRVISRTSAMRYRGSAKSIPEIAAELNVDGVVEGSVLRAGDRVRITAQLIHAASDAHRWAGNFQRELTDVLVMQGEIAGAIVSEIGLRLSPPERERLTRKRPVDPAAVEACLLGSYEWKKLTPAGLDAAQHAFEKAVAADPSYAPAHSGLSWVWAARQQMGLVPPSDALPRAKAAALEAVRLDPDCAEAHEALAVITTWGDWDWTVAEREWRRALDLNPNAANAHAYYAHFLFIVGRGEEAWAHSALALELDPFNALFHVLGSFVRYFARRYDEALSLVRKALSLQPEHPGALSVQWYVGWALDRHEEAIAAMRPVLDLFYGDAGVLDALDEGGSQGGHVEAYRRVAAALAERQRRTYTIPFDIASFFAAAGDADVALDWLERAFELRDGNLPYLCMPWLDPLRPTPRFRALQRRMNLPVP